MAPAELLSRPDACSVLGYLQGPFFELVGVLDPAQLLARRDQVFG